MTQAAANIAAPWWPSLESLSAGLGAPSDGQFLHILGNAFVTAGSFLDSLYMFSGLLATAFCLALVYACHRRRESLERIFSGLLAGRARRAEAAEMLEALRDQGALLELYDGSGEHPAFLGSGRMETLDGDWLALRLAPGSIPRSMASGRLLTVYFRPVQGHGGFRNHFHTSLLGVSRNSTRSETVVLRPPTVLYFSPRRRYPRLDLPRSELVAGHMWFGQWEDGSNAFRRHAPALNINQGDPQAPESARVEDISAGGMRLSLPMEGKGGAFSRGREVCLQLFVSGPGGKRTELWLGGVVAGVARVESGRVLVSLKFAAYGLGDADAGNRLLRWERVDDAEGLPSIARLVAGWRDGMGRRTGQPMAV